MPIHKHIRRRALLLQSSCSSANFVWDEKDALSTLATAAAAVMEVEEEEDMGSCSGAESETDQDEDFATANGARRHEREGGTMLSPQSVDKFFNERPTTSQQPSIDGGEMKSTCSQPQTKQSEDDEETEQSASALVSECTESDHELRLETKPRSNYPPGTRIKQYYRGTGWVKGSVVSCASDGLYTVVFDDGNEDQYTDGEMEIMCKIARLRVGSRISVYSTGDDCYYNAVVTNVRMSQKKCFHILYDDHGSRWIDIRSIPFRSLDEPCGKASNVICSTKGCMTSKILDCLEVCTSRTTVVDGFSQRRTGSLEANVEHDVRHVALVDSGTMAADFLPQSCDRGTTELGESLLLDSGDHCVEHGVCGRTFSPVLDLSPIRDQRNQKRTQTGELFTAFPEILDSSERSISAITTLSATDDWVGGTKPCFDSADPQALPGQSGNAFVESGQLIANVTKSCADAEKRLFDHGDTTVTSSTIAPSILGQDVHPAAPGSCANVSELWLIDKHAGIPDASTTSDQPSEQTSAFHDVRAAFTPSVLPVSDFVACVETAEKYQDKDVTLDSLPSIQECSRARDASCLHDSSNRSDIEIKLESERNCDERILVRKPPVEHQSLCEYPNSPIKSSTSGSDGIFIPDGSCVSMGVAAGEAPISMSFDSSTSTTSIEHEHRASSALPEHTGGGSGRADFSFIGQRENISTGLSEVVAESSHMIMTNPIASELAGVDSSQEGLCPLELLISHSNDENNNISSLENSNHNVCRHGVDVELEEDRFTPTAVVSDGLVHSEIIMPNDVPSLKQISELSPDFLQISLGRKRQRNLCSPMEKYRSPCARLVPEDKFDNAIVLESTQIVSIAAVQGESAAIGECIHSCESEISGNACQIDRIQIGASGGPDQNACDDQSECQKDCDLVDTSEESDAWSKGSSTFEHEIEKQQRKRGRRPKAQTASRSTKQLYDRDRELAERLSDIECITVGTRLSIYWPEDKRYYCAAVVKQRSGRKPLLVRYDDDGEQEWINLREHKFRLLPGSKRIRDQRNQSRDTESKTNSKKRPLGDASQVSIGSRISVWWEDDKKYYPGTVTDRRPRRNPFFIEYDDGEDEWIDLKKHQFFLLSDEGCDVAATSRDSDGKKCKTDGSDKKRSNRTEDGARDHCSMGDDVSVLRLIKADKVSLNACNDNPPKRRNQRYRSNHFEANECDRDALRSAILVGTRLSIWWPNERKYFDCTVTNTRESKKGHYLEYDDGDEEWIDLCKEKFKILEDSDDDGNNNKSSKVEIGSRLSIYWPLEKQNFDCTVTRQRKGKKSFYVAYDDGDEEWVDLSKEEFHFLKADPRWKQRRRSR